MGEFKTVRAVSVCACLAVSSLTVIASGAIASGLNVCVPEKEGAAIVTPVKGACKAKSTATVLLPKAEQEKLQAILPHVNYSASGVGGKPTIQLSGVNVQIVNGEGKTASVNGEGNLVIGYDREPGDQTGSHDLVLGDRQSYTSYGGILGGTGNTAEGPGSAVLGNGNRTTAKDWSGGAIVGGENNVIEGGYGVIVGGKSNKIGEATESATIVGGVSNEIAYLGEASSILGGSQNHTTGGESTIGGGHENLASGGGHQLVVELATLPVEGCHR